MRRQRGYNLVETAIALTVLALVLGGALVPLQQRFEQAEIESAQQQLAAAKKAVQSYALLNATAASRVVYYDGVEYALPAGRPYLPCPDIDNDGLEDRTAIPAARPLPDTALATAGICAEQKGLLPWKTLGIKELDPWGNRLVYRVDKNFSSRLTGFDETFHADIFDAAAAPVVNLGTVQYQPHASRDETGALVCSRFYDDSTAGGCPDADVANLEAGVVSTVQVVHGARVIPGYVAVGGPDPEGIVDGVAFVILTHGRDGNGAISRQGRCRPPPRKTYDMAESANAYYRPAHPFRSPPFDCFSPPTSVPLRENLFVDRPISSIVDVNLDAPDDLLVWGGGNELYGFLARGGVLPLKKLEYLPQ